LNIQRVTSNSTESTQLLHLSVKRFELDVERAAQPPSPQID
jgi:hypothetical protein